jgi:hypothetical protein
MREISRHQMQYQGELHATHTPDVFHSSTHLYDAFLQHTCLRTNCQSKTPK